FDVARKAQLEYAYHPGKAISCLAYEPDGKTFLAGRLGARDNVERWESATLQRRAYLHGHTDFVRGLALTPDGWTLATAGADHTVRLWDPGGGRLVATLRGHGSSVEAVSWAPDSAMLASGDKGGVIHLWDSARELRHNTLTVHSRSGVNDLAIGPNQQA